MFLDRASACAARCLAQDSFGLGVALYNIGWVKFSRYQLHLGHGEEGHIREALVWYGASVRYTEMLGSLREWVLDYAKAAECIAILLTAASEISKADRNGLLDRARGYLDRIREVAAPNS